MTWDSVFDVVMQVSLGVFAAYGFLTLSARIEKAIVDRLNRKK